MALIRIGNIAVRTTTSTFARKSKPMLARMNGTRVITGMA
jgi:hypothetical protein